MRQIRLVETFDKVTHKNIGDAKKHLEKLYADKLCAIAHTMVRLDSYSPVCAYIDGNLEKFMELKQIKDDMEFDKESVEFD